MKIINYLKLILYEVRRLRKELSSFLNDEGVVLKSAEDLTQIEEMHERIKAIQYELEYDRKNSELIRSVLK